MDVNTFTARSQQQITAHRIREALDYALNSAREADYPQFKILCLHTVVEICHYYAGDGEASCAWCSSLLNWMDKNLGVIAKIPSLREVMEDMYIKECEILADAAVSYEEYFESMEKIRPIRPHTDLQSGQVDLIRSMQEEGQPWSTNMLFLATRYAGANDNMGQSNTMYSTAAALYGLMLQNRRKLRLSRTDLKLALTNYSASIGNITEEADNFYKNTPGSLNPNDYLFMYEKAICLIDESKKDVLEPDAGKEQIAYLREQREALLNMAPSGSALTSAPDAMGIIERPELLDEIMESKSRTGKNYSGSSRSAVVLRLVLVAASLYFATTRGEWWWYGCAVFFILSIVGGLLSMKKKNRPMD